jgi:hypothetical protein
MCALAAPMLAPILTPPPDALAETQKFFIAVVGDPARRGRQQSLKHQRHKNNHNLFFINYLIIIQKLLYFCTTTKIKA